MAARSPQCPLRPGDACSLCVPGTTGPEDCPTVAEVMRDPDLRARLAELRAELRAGHLAQMRAAEGRRTPEEA